MSPQHTFIRNVLNEVCASHRHGYPRLRFMIEWTGDTYRAFIGAKRYFARDDGTYVPPDVRSKCVALHAGAPVPFDHELRQMVRELSQTGKQPYTEVVVGVEVVLSIDGQDVLSGQDDDDIAYVSWAKSLNDFLSAFDFALPVRTIDEFLQPERRALRVEFLSNAADRPIAPTTFYPAPPGGILFATPALQTAQFSMAQPRDDDAPSLLWSNCRRETRDQIIDRLYEGR